MGHKNVPTLRSSVFVSLVKRFRFSRFKRRFSAMLITLLALPVEIRCMIYEYVFGYDKYGVPIHQIIVRPKGLGLRRIYEEHDEACKALQLVNKQIRSEVLASITLLSATEWKFVGEDFYPMKVPFLHSEPDFFRNVRYLALEFGSLDFTHSPSFMRLESMMHRDLLHLELLTLTPTYLNEELERKCELETKFQLRRPVEIFLFTMLTTTLGWEVCSRLKGARKIAPMLSLPLFLAVASTSEARAEDVASLEVDELGVGTGFVRQRRVFTLKQNRSIEGNVEEVMTHRNNGNDEQDQSVSFEEKEDTGHDSKYQWRW